MSLEILNIFEVFFQPFKPSNIISFWRGFLIITAFAVLATILSIFVGIWGLALIAPGVLIAMWVEINRCFKPEETKSTGS